MKTDVLIIGGGISGVLTALRLAEHKINSILISGEKIGCESSSSLSRGAITFPGLSSDDSIIEFMEDVKKNSFSFWNEKIFRNLSKKADKTIEWLIKIGTKFEMTESNFIAELAPGHSYPRLIFLEGKFGKKFMPFFRRELLNNKRTMIIENMWLVNLAKEKTKFIAFFLNKDKNRGIAIVSSFVVLANGGIAGLYKYSTNPDGNIGIGWQVALENYARLIDVEFVQFYPLSVISKDFLDSPAIVETIMAFGAKLYNKKKENFMLKYDFRGDMATRDVKSLAIYRELKEKNDINGGVVLDFSHIHEGTLKKVDPLLYKAFLEGKVKEKKILVSPAAHYSLGGILVNEFGETTTENLFAVGEITGGIHGASRLAGNSLLECLVMSMEIADVLESRLIKKAFWDTLIEAKVKDFERLENANKEFMSEDIFRKYSDIIKKEMWDNVSIERNEVGLKEAKEKFLILLESFETKKFKGLNKYKLLAMIKNSLLIVEAALKRNESRGTHFRKDYPEMNKNYNSHIVFFKKKGEIKYSNMNSFNY